MRTFNQLKDSLTPQDIDELIELIAARSGKDDHIKRVLTREELRKKIPNKPIFDRLWKNDTFTGEGEDRWRFFAVIDARSELKMLRNILLEVKNG